MSANQRPLLLAGIGEIGGVIAAQLALAGQPVSLVTSA